MSDRVKRRGWVVLAVALIARLSVVAWAHGRFEPIADAHYYHRLASRIAAGEGYTWLWPDGTVTHAAHYPVGFPALIAGPYALFGTSPTVAMIVSAVLGALGAFAVYRLLVAAERPRAAFGAGLLAALHPGLLGYTPALMTEGVTAALLALAAWALAAAHRRRSRAGLALTGLVLGISTLVRPQSLLVAPAFGALWRRRGILRRLGGAAVVTAVALAVCAPWTVRNCLRMDRCALVSMNGGWNLLIGTDPGAGGGWAPLEVPPACEGVFDEAEKDLCFERRARARIRSRPGAWLSLVPDKLSATFDACGAAGWYLHDAGPEAFDARAKLVLGAAELVFERLLLLLALIGAASGSRRYGRTAVAIVGALSALSPHATVGFLAWVWLAATSPSRGAPWLATPAFAVLSTAVVHAVFFGGGRYQLVVQLLLCAPAAVGAAAVGRRLSAATPRRGATRRADAGRDARPKVAGARS